MTGSLAKLALKTSFFVLLAALLLAMWHLPVQAQDDSGAQPETASPSRPQSLIPGRAPARDAVPDTSGTPAPVRTSAPRAGPPVSSPAVVPDGAVPLDAAATLGLAGPLTLQNGGYGPDLWSGSAGRFVNLILPKLPAPIGSRFGQIALRRALATRAEGPAGAEPIPFHAARTHLLLRLGEADLASRLAGQVAQPFYTRQMYTVAVQAHLSAMNVPATCPLAAKAIVFSPDNLWPLLTAICSGIQGDEGGAALGLDIARQSDKLKVNRFDLWLADRMLTAVTGGGRGGVIDWPDDGLLTSFRLAGVYGSGQALPVAALRGKNSAVMGWLAKSGLVDSSTRTLAGWTAAATGVLTTDEWIGLWAQRGSLMSPSQLAYAPEGLLLRANTAPVKERLAVMKQIWTMNKTARGNLSGYLLTADAATRIPPDGAHSAAAPDLVRSMILGGRFEQARTWWTILAAQKKNAAALEIWAPLELIDWDHKIPATSQLLEQWIKAQPSDLQKRRGKLLVGALKGLGYAFAATADVPRIDDAPSGAVYERLRDATRRHAKGEVIVLGALIMGSTLDSISAESLQEVTGAYRGVGLEFEARLIAAEVVLQAGRDQ
jgi:hypothetical protein